MFDYVELTVRAGAGGSGTVSFRREKFVPFGGPDGGDGGSGGDVVFKADLSVTNLKAFRQKGIYRAEEGKVGGGKKKHGRGGKDLVLDVPVGTVVLSRLPTGNRAVVADLEEVGQQAVVAKGGKGGLGNIHFVSSTNQAPQLAQRGEKGEERLLFLELRLIADVGVIGFPNVGKSTMLTTVSAAKPKVAEYPFTTLEPILGMVEVDNQSFVVAEIPGLIDGAHLGRGLGHDFLRHVLRTKILIHLINGNSRSPVEDMIRINTEISFFDPDLARKPQLVAVNKVDLPAVQVRLSEIRRVFKAVGISVFFISAVTGEGVPVLMAAALRLLGRVATEAKADSGIPRKIFRPQPERRDISVHKEGDAFVVASSDLERMVTKTGELTPELRRQIDRQLTRMGVHKALEKAGIKPGDKVRCGSIEWEWI